MGRFRSVVAGILVLGIGAGGAWWWSQPEEQADLQYFSNRIWAERMPKDKRDMVLFFTPLKVGKKQFGASQRQSHYRVLADRFEWTLSKDTVSLSFPQDGRRAKVKVRSWECKGQAPKPFDLCLELAQGDRKVQLYSRRHWVVPRKGEGALEIPFDGVVEPLPDGACADCVDGAPSALEALGL